MDGKIKIICVVGATASGKTALGVELAKRLNGEIISADSMQVYKGMSIATAAADVDEQQGIEHHLLEFLNPDESFSVADFVKLAQSKIQLILQKGKVPIIVGGTGLFIDSLVKNITFSDVAADNILRRELADKTNDELFDMLLKVDPQSAKSIHKNNRKRVIRALELYYNGTSKTQQNIDSQTVPSPYEALYIGINYADRDNLYSRINRRVDLMVEKGLLEEAKSFSLKSASTSKQAIGHKELQGYFDGSLTLDEALNNLKQATRRYAKRQLTWFRKNEKIVWLYADEQSPEILYDTAEKVAKDFLK